MNSRPGNTGVATASIETMQQSPSAPEREIESRPVLQIVPDADTQLVLPWVFGRTCARAARHFFTISSRTAAVSPSTVKSCMGNTLRTWLMV